MKGMRRPPVLFVQSRGSGQELTRALSAMGLASEGFPDPKQFLLRLKKGAPSACFFDLSFDDAPILVAVIRSIRGVLPQMPLVALVLASDKQLNAQVREAGVTEIIRKPVDPDEVIGALARHLGPAGSARIEIPPLVRWYFEKLSPVMAGLAGSLCEADELETRIKFYEERFAPFGESFIALVQSIRKIDGKSEPKPDLTQSIRMYGMRNARNLEVSLKLSALTGLPLVQWNPRGPGLIGEPVRAVKFAAKTVETFGEGSRNEDTVFNAGLVLDVLSTLAEETAGRKAKVRKFIQDRYELAMIRAERCIEAGRELKNLALERHIVSAILMREAGRMAMATFFPDYLELRRKFEKTQLSPALQHLVEERQYAVSHNLIGAMICQGVPGLSEAYKAVLFLDYPFMLAGVEDLQDAKDLVTVCNLG